MGEEDVRDGQIRQRVDRPAGPGQPVRPARLEVQDRDLSAVDLVPATESGRSGRESWGAEGMLLSGLRVWRRNWSVAIVGLLLTSGLVVAAVGLVPASYVATSQMVLLPPAAQRNGGENVAANPYLNLAGLHGMADIVARSMMDDETARNLRQAGVTKYTVLYDTLSAGPVLRVTAEESGPAKASAALETLTKQVPLTTARLQRATAADPRFYVTTAVVARSGPPQRSGKSQLRAVGLALVGGLVLTQLAVALIDAWRRRRALAPPSGPAGRAEPASEPLPGAEDLTPEGQAEPGSGTEPAGDDKDVDDRARSLSAAMSRADR